MFSTNKASGRAAAAAIDPNFPNVSLLLHGDGTNAAQNNTFIDSSPNNFTITRNGNTTQGSLSPFGDRWSNYFDGTGDFLNTASSTSFGFGTGNFTFECWVFPTSNPANGPGTLLDLRSGALAEGFAVRLFSDLKVGAYIGPANTFVYSTGTVTLNTWTHIAVVRSGTTLTFFINGADSGTATVSNDLGSTWAARIGSNYAAGFDYFGYLSNYRIVKGTALYTANFTPSTSPLTAVSNTSLLTCHANRFVDGSSNNFTITRNGDVRVEKFSPFAPTAAYLPATVGGSAYFDGTGDYLTIPANAAFVFGTGDFTVEAWVYRTALSSIFAAIATNWTTGWWFGFNNNQLTFLRSGGTAVVTNASTTPVSGWFHCAVSRQSGTTRLFINGAQVASAADTNDYSGNNTIFVGQTDASNHPYTGYISNLRVVKGTAVYTAAFTPPAAPVTAITNTSLLLNFTNAGIFDNAAQNDLETLGTAQVSTAQKKYGTGSLYLAGGGSNYLLSLNSDVGRFGTGDFTVECWIYPIASAAFGTLISFEVGAQTNVDATFSLGLDASLFPRAGTRSVFVVASSTALTANVWSHLAVSRASGTWRLFINGSQVATASNTTSFVSGGAAIGTLPRSTGNTAVNAYVDDLRITNGVARYVANFTPPTTAFPDQ